MIATARIDVSGLLLDDILGSVAGGGDAIRRRGGTEGSMTSSTWPDLSDRSVLVTGAAGGIGRVVTRALAEAGARLLITDADDRIEGIHDALADSRHLAMVADLSQSSSPQRLVDAALKAFGSIDGLVHMAAVLRRRSSVNSVTEEDWDVQHNVNLKASFLLARAAAETMRNRGGRIVLFSSQGWWTGGLGGSVVYASTKGGIVSLARGLARTYGPDQITVNTVSPGFVDTSMLREGLSNAELDTLVASTPLGRLAQPEDLTGSVLFLLSDHAAFITGATLNVSGGFLMY